MADDKNFKELVKEMQDLNKSITKQNESRESQLTDLTNAQDKTTEIVTRRLTIAQKEQLEKDNEKIAIEKEKAAAAEKLATTVKKDSRMKMLATRVSDKLKKGASNIKDGVKFATYQNRVMRNLGKGIGKLNKGLGIGKMYKAGKDTLFGTIKKLIQGGFAIGGILLLDKFFNSDSWPIFLKVMKERVIPGFKKVIDFLVQIGKNMLKVLDEDKTGSKLFESIASFFTMIGALFGVGMDDLDKDGVKLGYTENLKQKSLNFLNNLFDAFESLVRVTLAGLGYTTKNENLFEGIKDDLVIMFKRIVSAIGEAFYEAFPKIANLFGIKSAAENKVLRLEDSKRNKLTDELDSRGKKKKLSQQIFDTVAYEGGAGLKKMFDDANDEDKAFMTEYANAINEFERQKIDNQGLIPYFANAQRNAVVAGILGKDAFKDGAGGYDQRLGTTANDAYAALRNLLNFKPIVTDNEKGFVAGSDRNDLVFSEEEFREKKRLKELKEFIKLQQFTAESANLTNEQIIKKLDNHLVSNQYKDILRAIMESNKKNNPIVDASTNNRVSNKQFVTTNGLAGNSNGALLGFSYTGMNNPH